MLTKLNSVYAKFKTISLEPDELQVNHVLVIAFAVIATAGLVVLFVVVLTWPVAIFSVLYAGCSGR